jgi:hypothetical protein
MDFTQILTRFDKLIDMLRPEDMTCTLRQFKWSAEWVNERQILIKYNYTRDFERFVKSQKLVWLDRYKGWVTDDRSIVYKIQNEFPEWTFCNYLN